MGTVIETANFCRFDFVDPRPEQIVIDDIAHALSNICRFGGHTRIHWSVAHHSLLVSRLLKSSGKSRVVQFAGLMHDSQEAYVGDIPTPLKRMLGASFSDIENRVWGVIASQFGIDPVLPPEVHEADYIALLIERQVFYNGSPHPFDTGRPAIDLRPYLNEIQVIWQVMNQQPLYFLDHGRTKQTFLNTFHELHDSLRENL